MNSSMKKIIRPAIPPDKLHILIDGKLFNNIEAYCEKNGISNVDRFVELMLQNAFRKLGT